MFYFIYKYTIMPHIRNYDGVISSDGNVVREKLIVKQDGFCRIPTPTEPMHAATKKYVDNAVAGADGAQGPAGAAGADGPQGPAGADGAGGGGALNDLSDVLVGTNSLYIGNEPSTITTADYNIGIGITALDAVTTGVGNVAIGYEALTANESGGSNAAVGIFSLYSNTTGSENIALGTSALATNTTGESNIALGNYALNINNGNYNVATGYQAGRNINTGSNNTIYGNQCGEGLETGSNNVAIGSSASINAAAINKIVIGANVSGSGVPDNTAVIGNVNVSSLYASQNGNATVYCGAININGNQVLGQQGNAVADVGGTAGDSSTDNSAIITDLQTKLNALLAVLRTHGIIAT